MLRIVKLHRNITGIARHLNESIDLTKEMYSSISLDSNKSEIAFIVDLSIDPIDQHILFE